MAKKRCARVAYVQPYRYASPNIPLSAIQRFARRIAKRFHPEKIILFGSYAYGRPHGESDAIYWSSCARAMPLIRPSASTSRSSARSHWTSKMPRMRVGASAGSWVLCG